jgi:hypothetical protein
MISKDSLTCRLFDIIDLERIALEYLNELKSEARNVLLYLVQIVLSDARVQITLLLPHDIPLDQLLDNNVVLVLAFTDLLHHFLQKTIPISSHILKSNPLLGLVTTYSNAEPPGLLPLRLLHAEYFVPAPLAKVEDRFRTWNQVERCRQSGALVKIRHQQA